MKEPAQNSRQGISQEMHPLEENSERDLAQDAVNNTSIQTEAESREKANSHRQVIPKELHGWDSECEKKWISKAINSIQLAIWTIKTH